MTVEEITLIENQIFTQLLLDEFKRQKKAAVIDYLIDKYEIEKKTQDELRKILKNEI